MRALIFACMLIGCTPQAFGPIPDESGTACIRAEKRLIDIGCAIGRPTDKGTTFAQFCLASQRNGYDIRPNCIAKVSSCAEADRCNR